MTSRTPNATTAGSLAGIKECCFGSDALKLVVLCFYAILVT